MDAKISISVSINKLQDVLREEETNSNPRLQKQVQTAINNLHSLDRFLTNLEAPVNDEKTCQLLKAVYSAEDAVDVFVINKAIQGVEKIREDERKRSMSYTQKVKFFCSCKMKTFDDNQTVFNRRMKKFDDEVRRLVVVVEKKEDGNLDIGNNNNGDTLALRSFQDGFCLEEEKHVVGLEQQTNDLVAKLIPQLMTLNDGNEIVQEQHRRDDDDDDDLLSTQLIAVVGEGGSGKTTLARTVYNRVDVKRHFTNRAWVRVSGVFKARDVLADLLEQINQAELFDASMVSENDLMERLSELLKGVRFLLVLEDVDKPEIWKTLQAAFSCSSQGSRIIITTRSMDNLPPDHAADSTLNMCRLSNEESWRLFSHKVRIAENELNNSQLVTLKQQILEICGGLPSAIVLLGGLLSNKIKSCDEWSRVLSMVANKASEDIIALSYQDLPSLLKPCFLHMGLFPRGFEIPVRRLIHLWRAEGFVHSLENIDPEDLAELCLEELVIRNMVEVRWRLDGTPKTCCLPNVLYNVFSSKAVNVGFLCHQFLSSHTSPKQQKFPIRRLAACDSANYFPPSYRGAWHLRSYVAFDTRVRITAARGIDMLLDKIIIKKGFALLEVLDLEGVFKPRLYDNVVGKLVQLRYLGLRSTFLDYLPDSVGNLPFLETLDVKHTNIFVLKLPKATKLQHVYLNRNLSESSFLESLDAEVIANLRTLWGLNIHGNDIAEKCCSVLHNMVKITKLKLTLRVPQPAIFHKLAECIRRMTQLRSLKLRSVGPSCKDYLIILRNMSQYQKLEELYLLGWLERIVIDVRFFPPSLKKLTLSLSRLQEGQDPMPVLGMLPHLNILRIYSAYTGRQMTCPPKGFPKLRVLKLWNLPLQVWNVEEGAMPCLRELEIRSCTNLAELPQGLQNLTTLKELVLTNMPTAFAEAAEKSFKGSDVYIRNNTWNSKPFPI